MPPARQPAATWGSPWSGPRRDKFISTVVPASEPGPTPRGLSISSTSFDGLSSQLPPVVMGPGLRRDDPRGASITASPRCRRGRGAARLRRASTKNRKTTPCKDRMAALLQSYGAPSGQKKWSVAAAPKPDPIRSRSAFFHHRIAPSPTPGGGVIGLGASRYPGEDEPPCRAELCRHLDLADDRLRQYPRRTPRDRRTG
jgi:hypothetical protein